MKNKTVAATLAALIAQIIFGFSFMFTKISMKYASPLIPQVTNLIVQSHPYVHCGLRVYNLSYDAKAACLCFLPLTILRGE